MIMIILVIISLMIVITRSKYLLNKMKIIENYCKTSLLVLFSSH